MDHLNTLWQKYLRGELSREETRQLSEAMENEENQLPFFQLMKKEWNTAENEEHKTASDRELLKKIRKELGMKKRNPSVRRLFGYTAAACLLLLLGLGTWWGAVHFSGGEDLIRLEVAAGQPARAFTLPDSSVVWLNSATILEYREDFTQVRDIKLKGEAYFKVTPDNQHPFRVKFRDNELMVTGTRFLVKAYDNEEISRVGVEEGSVRVYYQADSTNLKRNNSLVIDEQNNTVAFNVTDFKGADSWKEGMLNFKNIPLEEALKTLERFYNVRIDAGTLPDAAGDRHITAVYPSSTSLEEVMEGLSHLQDLRYEFINKNIVKITTAPDRE